LSAASLLGTVWSGIAAAGIVVSGRSTDGASSQRRVRLWGQQWDTCQRLLLLGPCQSQKMQVLVQYVW
jgi:hypothetical protein